MLGGYWPWVASSGAAVLVGVIILIPYFWRGLHKDDDGSIAGPRTVSYFTNAAATYTFLVACSAELVFEEPHLSTIISEGFGDERMSWLLLAVVLNNIFVLLNTLIGKNEVNAP